MNDFDFDFDLSANESLALRNGAYMHSTDAFAKIQVSIPQITRWQMIGESINETVLVIFDLNVPPNRISIVIQCDSVLPRTFSVKVIDTVISNIRETIKTKSESGHK